MVMRRRPEIFCANQLIDIDQLVLASVSLVLKMLNGSFQHAFALINLADVLFRRCQLYKCFEVGGAVSP